VQVAPVLTRRTIDLLKEHIEERVYLQIVEWYESSLGIFDLFLRNDLATMKRTFHFYSQKFFPHRVAFIQILMLLLGKEMFEQKYLELLRTIEEEILARAARKSISPDGVRSIYTRYEDLFTRVWNIFSRQIPHLHVVEQDFQANVDDWVTASTQFDFGFTALNLVLLDEVKCESKAKARFLLGITSEKLDDFVSLWVQLERILISAPARHLYSFAGAIKTEEAQAVIAAIEQNCEKVDVEW
jgi:hypothetical protein